MRLDQLCDLQSLLREILIQNLFEQEPSKKGEEEKIQELFQEDSCLTYSRERFQEDA
jgi:hypothetical protein